MRWILLPLLLAALAGCASMDADECRTADWRVIGYEDGAAGRTLAQFSEHRKACAEHHIAADFDAYRAGRDEGLTHFCRPYNGYLIGTRGRAYAGVCPPELEAGFVAAHADGYGLYQRKATLDRIGKRLHHTSKRAKDIEYQLADTVAHLAEPKVGTAERAALAVELKQLTEEKVELEAEIDALEHEYARAEQEYESYNARIASRRAN